MSPGLRLSGVWEEDTAASLSDRGSINPESEDCAKSAVNDLSGHSASNPKIRRVLNPVYIHPLARQFERPSARLLQAAAPGKCG